MPASHQPENQQSRPLDKRVIDDGFENALSEDLFEHPLNLALAASFGCLPAQLDRGALLTGDFPAIDRIRLKLFFMVLLFGFVETLRYLGAPVESHYPAVGGEGANRSRLVIPKDLIKGAAFAGG